MFSRCDAGRKSREKAIDTSTKLKNVVRYFMVNNRKDNLQRTKTKSFLVDGEFREPH